MTPEDIIDQIEIARSRNNLRWVDILRIAMRYAPDQTRAVMRNINTEDDNISRLTKQLTEKYP